jgi:hypothetical protein
MRFEVENLGRLNSVRRHIHEGQIDEGIKQCLELVELGSAEAQDYLGILYCVGIGVPKDRAKAEYYFLLSHNRGYAMGTYHLAGEYQRESKTKEALELHKSIAEINPSAAYWAFRDLETLALENDELNREADKYLRLASQMGHAQANKTIAIRTIKGNYGLIKIPYGIYLLVKAIVFGVRSVTKGERFKYIDSLGPNGASRLQEMCGEDKRQRSNP